MTQPLPDTGLILFSHGSLLCGAGSALDDHADRIRTRGIYGAVEVGYLNYTEPSFLVAVERILAIGIKRIVVVPFFLVPGYFVTTSLPKQVASALEEHPDLEFIIADPLGTDARLADALIDAANAPLARSEWRSGANVSVEACRLIPECPNFGSSRCPLGALAYDVNVAPIKLSDPVGLGASSTEDPRTRALLVLVHGSPKPEANNQMYAVVEMIRKGDIYPIIEVGFMECNEPDIPSAIERCVDAGAQSVVAVPYFLHSGTHVTTDLPDAIEEAQTRYPVVAFEMGDYLGRSQQVTEVLLDRAACAGS